MALHTLESLAWAHAQILQPYEQGNALHRKLPYQLSMTLNYSRKEVDHCALTSFA